MALLADPNVAYLLMLIGFYGILFELQNPGAVLPGIVGAIALVLAFFALSTLAGQLGRHRAHRAGVVFFLPRSRWRATGCSPRAGVVAVAGLIAAVSRRAGACVLRPLIGGATLVTAAFFLLVVGAGIRAQRRRVTTGPSR